MTDLNFDFEQLVKNICAAFNNEWEIIKSEIREVFTIQHYTYKVQIRFRYVMSGAHEGQLKVMGRLCGVLESYNPVYNDIFPSGETKATIYLSPQRTADAIKRDVERRLLPTLYETMRKAEEAYRKASERKLRILAIEEDLITASRNQLIRDKRPDETMEYRDKRGRSVNVAVSDPQAHAAPIEIILKVDADEAELVLRELFNHWFVFLRR